MKYKVLLLLIPLAFAVQSCGSEYDYDIIIRNGMIYDGSGDQPYKGDLALNGDKIAALGDLSETRGATEIDAAGLAVSPGFINMLSWANESLIEDGRSQGDIRQGVTLEVMGEGSSMGPLTEQMKHNKKENQNLIQYEVEWTTLGEYLQFLEDKGVSTNVASFIGNGTLRRYAVGLEDKPVTEEEMQLMKDLIKQAMEEGAIGLSSSLEYVPSIYADQQELTELAAVAAVYDGLYISHIRNEDELLIESVTELINIAREAGIWAEIYHLKAAGMDNWDKLDSVFTLVEEARAEGLHITADMYNYPASSTGLNIILPQWVKDGGHDATMKRFQDPVLRQKAIDEVKFRCSPDSTLLVGFKNEQLRHYIGKSVGEIARERNISPNQAVVDLIEEDDSRISAVYFYMSPENLNNKISQPWMSFCSDAGSYTTEGVFLKQSTHPRAYGSFARLLRKYVREDQIIPLQEAIRKLTSLPAANMKIKNRGLLKEGYFGDVVVFDPVTVTDNATFAEPHQYATGVEHVWVNGVQVLKLGEHTGATPGRFVKGPGFKKN